MKNLTEGSGQVRRSSRYDYARAITARYRRAGRREKGRILDEFCAATGYSRRYPLGLLKRPPPEPAGVPRPSPGADLRPGRAGPAADLPRIVLWVYPGAVLLGFYGYFAFKPMP